MTWLLTFWAKAKTWFYALLAILAAIGSAWLYGRHQGDRKTAAKDQAQQAQEAVQSAQQVAKTIEVSSETQSRVQALPVAPVQPVATAAPDTAAGELRDNWSAPN